MMRSHVSLTDTFMPLDLSHIYTGDPDEGQKNHGDLPHAAKLHLAMAFAAHAGLAKSPGEYKGPAVKPPDDWETPQDLEGQQEMAESEALQNTADMGNPPVIPTSAPAKKEGPPALGSPVDFSSLGS
jgi:hypothetical protein